MQNTRRKLLSQNFLRSPRLVAQLVKRSSLGLNDLVVEIGPGNGMITKELLAHSREVHAIELDPYWYAHLKSTLDTPKLYLYHADFLTFPLPRAIYKVFANIPFAIEGKIIRKLLNAPVPPQDTYLIMARELVQRFITKQPSLLTALYHPWFDFRVVYHFKPSDFSPIPDVHPVLLQCQQKILPNLPIEHRIRFQQFVTLGYGNGRQVRQNLRRAYLSIEIDKAMQELSLKKQSIPTDLHTLQWIKLYKKITPKTDRSAKVLESLSPVK